MTITLTPLTHVPAEALVLLDTKRRAWIQSYSGKVVTPAELQVEQVSFADIPHALAQKVRFTGHLRDMGYTVAQHCCIGSDQIVGPFKAAFLLHEVSEVFLPDVASPLKPLLSIDIPNGKQVNWEDLEEQHAKVIFEALGHSSLLPLIYSPEVKRMDLQMLMTEKRDLMGPEPEPWNIDATPLDITLGEIWAPARAKQEFIKRYDRLFGEGRMITVDWAWKDDGYWYVVADLNDTGSTNAAAADVPALRGNGISRKRDMAIAYALEDLAQKLKESR